MEPTPTPRSHFVSVVAWLFIVMSGFSTLMGLLQNIMVQTMFNGAGFDELATAPGRENVPAFALFMVDHFRLLFFCVLLVSATTLTASIGLLRRRNWARLLFIGLMALGIAWNVAGFAMQFAILSTFPSTFPEPNAGMEGFEAMKKVMLAFTGLMALGLSALFGWIIYKLLSAPIVAEFRSGR